MVNREEIKRLLHQAEQCLIVEDNLTAELFSREVIKLDHKILSDLAVLEIGGFKISGLFLIVDL